MITIHITPEDQIEQVLAPYAIDTPVEIILSPGIYRQKVRLSHHHLILRGSSAEITKFVYGDHAYQMHEDGLLYNTFRTATVTILGDHVTLVDLSIVNDAGFGPTIGQGIALSLLGLSTTVIRCHLVGYQDTLFVGPLPSDLTERYDGFLPPHDLSSKPTYNHIIDSVIEGAVDFIFGSGVALFDHSVIIATSKGYIAAPSTYPDLPYGFIFDHCTIIFKSSGVTYLARPWRDYGKVLFNETLFEGNPHHDRFDDWNKRTFRFIENPYYETSLSLPLSEEEAERLTQFIAAHFNRSDQ